MEVIKTDCGLCINCCGVNAYVENGKLVRVEGIPEHWLNKGGCARKVRDSRTCSIRLPV